MSFESIHKRLHPELKALMQDRAGSILTTAEINQLYKQTHPGFYPDSYIDWLRPSDHCINKDNKGACWCSMTEDAIFQFIKRGKYQVR